ncbi:transcriptional repressor protein YY1-like [Helicoverpa zea]|uniref:transcriptional repressor protein YY1-like n=1 Tax=Helicoverpa zea TaxID=7113 RepID=UPI001F5609E5|nr:transcriptional repressor protein YY1-like [Helicoverpa zea]
MNTFTFFALVICAIFALVSAVPQPDAEISINGAGPVPAELFEGAESRGYNRHGGGGGHGHYGHDHHHGHGHHGHGR